MKKQIIIGHDEWLETLKTVMQSGTATGKDWKTVTQIVEESGFCRHKVLSLLKELKKRNRLEVKSCLAEGIDGRNHASIIYKIKES